MRWIRERKNLKERVNGHSIKRGRVTLLEVVEFGGECHLDVSWIGGYEEVLSQEHRGKCSGPRLLNPSGEPFPWESKKVAFGECDVHMTNALNVS